MKERRKGIREGTNCKANRRDPIPGKIPIVAPAIRTLSRRIFIAWGSRWEKKFEYQSFKRAVCLENWNITRFPIPRASHQSKSRSSENLMDALNAAPSVGFNSLNAAVKTGTVWSGAKTPSG